MNRPLLSVILPVCNERQNIPPLIDEIDAALSAAGISYEIVAIDDGSTDGSAEWLADAAAERADLTLVEFRRNFGQSAAFDAGFRHARGRYIASLDADGQNDPADIPRMLEKLRSENLEFVSGERAKRKDGFVLRKLPSKIANWMIRRITGTKIRDLGCSLKLYDRAIVEHLHLYGEMHRFLAVLIETGGGRTGQLPVNHRARVHGQSKYGLTRTFKVLLDLATVWFLRGFATKPIYIFGGSALALFSGAVLCDLFVAYRRLVDGVYVHLQPLFIISMVMALAALQLGLLGLLAEVAVRTYFESRGRPPYDIRRVCGRRDETPKLKLSLADNLRAVSPSHLVSHESRTV